MLIRFAVHALTRQTPIMNSSAIFHAQNRVAALGLAPRLHTTQQTPVLCAAGPHSLAPLHSAPRRLEQPMSPAGPHSMVAERGWRRARLSTQAVGGEAATATQAQSSASAGSSRSSSGVSSQYVLVTGAYVLPHPEKMAKGGEDWFFVSESMRAIGVADGVGGWAEVGVDAGAYARQLMGHAKEQADKMTGSSSADFKSLLSSLNASLSNASQMEVTADSKAIQLQQTILEKAYYKTDVRGSSTACVCVMAGDRLLASNLGDSGFLIVRDGQVAFHSPQQQHDFNFPYQCGSVDSMSDPPSASQKFELVVQVGDVVILGTDGLWDNCFDEEIMSVVRYCQDVNMAMDKTAQVLAHYARHRASDPKFASPFAYAAFQAGFAYMGGKMDDITVVIARVAHASEVADNPLPGQGGNNYTLPGNSKM